MRLKDFYQINETAELNIPDAIRHTLPKTVIFPDMDLYYDYYKFVKAMACHPELNDKVIDDKTMRDVPVAVAYTPQEYDMIMSVAKRMGQKTEEIAFGGSQEPPGINTVSPVMKFDMFESNSEIMRGFIEEVDRVLNETFSPALRPDVESTISPTMIIPELVSSDAYMQYRYTLALAAARACAAGEVEFTKKSSWNENLAAIAYTDADMETIEMANKIMDVKGEMLSTSPSHEPRDTNVTSPVMKFNMFENKNKLFRTLKEYVEQIENTKD